MDEPWSSQPAEVVVLATDFVVDEEPWSSQPCDEVVVGATYLEVVVGVLSSLKQEKQNIGQLTIHDCVDTS